MGPTGAIRVHGLGWDWPSSGFSYLNFNSVVIAVARHPLQEARAVCQQKWVDNGFPATCGEHKFYTVLPKQRPGAIPAELRVS